MKKIIAIAAALVLSFSFLNASAASKKVQKQEVTFVTSMHCNKCAEKVHENIAFEKGVLGLDVKVDDKTVRIVYNPSKTSPETLAKAINKLGYTAEIKK